MLMRGGRFFSIVFVAAFPLCAATLPPCHADPTIDDTPMLSGVIQQSNTNGLFGDVTP